MGRYAAWLLCLFYAGCQHGGSGTFQDTPATSSVVTSTEAADESPAPREAAPVEKDRLSADRAYRSAPAGSVLSPVLMVNNESITINDILEPIRRRLEIAAGEMSPEQYRVELVRLIRQQLIDELNERLIWHEAQHRINEELDKRIETVIDRLEQERIQREFDGRESRYEKYLTEMGLARKDIRQRLKRRLVVEQYLRDRLLPRISIRKQDLLKYYEAHIEEFSQPRKVELFMIDVPFAAFRRSFLPATPEEREEIVRQAREHIEASREKILSGSPFEEVARSDSLGPLHRTDGGAWGTISAPLRGRYEAPSLVALKMERGQISDIIETPSGYFLVRVGDVEPAVARPFEEAQREIAERLRRQQFDVLQARFVRDAWRRAAIGEIEPFIEQIIVRAPMPGGDDKRVGAHDAGARDRAIQAAVP
jgi:hypothetical protein